jgi:hypothetical protein
MKSSKGDLRVNEKSRRILDHFSYVLAYAPDFPTEDGTSLEAEFARLLTWIRDLQNTLQDTRRKRWLEISVQELEESLFHYRAGDRNKGGFLMQSAEEHFKRWREDKGGPKSTFIVGPGGETERQ